MSPAAARRLPWSDLTIPSAMLVCTIGDLTLDVVVRLAGPVAAGGDVDAEIRVGPGGQAANVAAWAATLGVERALRRQDGRRRRGSAGPREARRSSGSRSRGRSPGATGRSARSCPRPASARWHRIAEPRASSQREDLEPAWLACDHLHVSGYALMADPVRHAALRAVELARRHGARVSVDLSSWSAIRDSGEEAFREAVRAIGARRRVRQRGRGAPRRPVSRRRSRGSSSAGARGCSFDGDEREALPVDEAVDSTGAGDALAAGWIVGGPDLALEAAARCVQHLGAMPIPSAA